MQLSREELIKAYTGMCMIREFDDAVHYEFAADAMPGFVHLYVGEEASAMGICMNLNEKDTIASTHRGHGHCIAKGCDVTEMMKELYKNLWNNKPINIQTAIEWMINNEKLSNKNKLVEDSKVNKDVNMKIDMWRKKVKYICDWNEPDKLLY